MSLSNTVFEIVLVLVCHCKYVADIGALTCPAQPGSFVLKIRQYVVNFSKSEFHQTWPRHVNSCPSICNGINLKKIPFASFAIRKLKIEWCQLDTLFWPACSLSDALHRVGQVNLMVSPHCSPRARGFSTRVSFCTTHGFGAAGRQFSVIFPFCLFSHTTCLKRIFRWPTAHGLTLQNPRESKRLFVQGYPFGGSERCSPKF